MIALDADPGKHGHFLEFVVNRYIFGVPASSANIFQSSGSSHKINLDSVYQKSKVLHGRHYSECEGAYPPETEKIVYVERQAKYDFVLLVNIHHRANVESMIMQDFDVEAIKQFHKNLLSPDPVEDWQLRNFWYAKLDEEHLKIHSKKLTTDIPRFDFDFGSFFNLNDFVCELQRLSNFFDLTLKFDHSLTELWLEFMKRNQGYALFVKCNEILEKTLANQYHEFDLDWQGQSYVNFVLSRMFRLYDGELFDHTPYPTNSQQLYQIIMNHLNSFDQRF